jgi:hypothetical protein
MRTMEDINTLDLSVTIRNYVVVANISSHRVTIFDMMATSNTYHPR